MLFWVFANVFSTTDIFCVEHLNNDKLFYLHSMKNRSFDHLFRMSVLSPLSPTRSPHSIDRPASISPYPLFPHSLSISPTSSPAKLPSPYHKLISFPSSPILGSFYPPHLTPPPPLRPPPNSPSYLWQFHSFSLPPPVFIVLSVLCPRWPSLSNPFLCCLFLLEKIRPHFRLSKPS